MDKDFKIFRSTAPSHAVPGVRPGEALRQFAFGILHQLGNAQHADEAGSCPSRTLFVDNLQEELARRLQGAVIGIAEELRREVAAWPAAIEHLRALAASPFLPARQLAVDLQRDLEGNQAHAFRLIEALEKLPAQRGLPAVKRCSVPTPISNARESLRRGDVCRRQGDYQRASIFYAEAICQEPRCAKAHLKRGQTLHLLGDLRGAVNDFTTVLQTDPANVEAHFRRGDVLAQLNLFDRAVKDYGRALQLNPTFLLARHNRAVVYERAGEHRLAIAELTEVLRQDRAFAAAYFNRGAVYLALKEYGNALQDFTTALKLNPKDAEAATKLRETRRFMETKAELPAPEPPMLAAEKANLLPLKTATKEAADKLEPRGNNLIRVACPDCGTSGAIPWDRLGRILICKACAQHYRVKGDGQLVAITQAPNGRWLESAKLKPTTARLLRRWVVSGTAAAAIVLAGIALLFPRANYAASVSQLPRDLEPRVELMTKAWLSKDVPMMRQLTLSTYERGIFSWLLRHPPPVAEKLSSADLETLRIQIHQRRKSDETADVVARVQGLPTTTKGNSVEFPQRWEERQGTWFFIPPNR